MAKGRFVSKAIATDRELNVLCSFEADYVFQRCIPHLDVEGRMDGFADVVKATSCPLRSEVDVEMVRACLAELQEYDLVRWYDVENRRYLEFPGFEDHQKGLRPEREADSKVPPANSSDATPVEYSGPTPEQLRMRSAQEKLSEGKGSEVKGAGESLPSVETSPGQEPAEETTRKQDRSSLAGTLRSDAQLGRSGDAVEANMRKSLDIADELHDAGYSYADQEDAVRGARLMIENREDAFRGWIGPGETFGMGIFRHAKEQGVKLIETCKTYWYKHGVEHSENGLEATA